VFTVIMSVNYAAYGIATLVAGPLTDTYGPRWIYGVVGLVLLLASLIAYVLGREQVPEHTAEVKAA
jgi:MFS family permease